MLKIIKAIILSIKRKPLLCGLLLAGVLALRPFAVQAQGGKNTPFNGVWETVAGSATLYTVRLTQIGNKVTGTYSPHNGKITGGIVVGNKLTFKWAQDGGNEGTGEFILDADQEGFSGSATATKPTPVTHSWKTYRPDPPSSFAGTWETTLGFSKITLTITQKGDQVTGTYLSEKGTIEGTVLAKVLRFKWRSDAGRGSGQLRISTSGMTFTGWTNKGTDPDVEGTRWEGSRTAGGNGAAAAKRYLRGNAFPGTADGVPVTGAFAHP